MAGEIEDSRSRAVRELVNVAEKECPTLQNDNAHLRSPALERIISAMLVTTKHTSFYLDALLDVLSRPWFCQTWIFQEAVLCPNLALIIGSIQIKGLATIYMIVRTAATAPETKRENTRICESEGWSGEVFAQCAHSLISGPQNLDVLIVRSPLIVPI